MTLLPLAHAHFESLGTFEWMLVGIAALIGGWTIWLAVKYTLRPGEDEPDHVKRSILDDPRALPVGGTPPPVPPGVRGSGDAPAPRAGR
jgi:hypothetical protein